MSSNSNREALLTAGLERFQAGEFSEAEDCYKQVLNTDPNDPDALHLLGLCRHQAGQNDEAIEYIKTAIANAGSNEDFLNNLGQIYKATGNLTDAAGCYRRVIAQNPAFADAHNNLGNVLSSQGRPDEAIGCFQRALDADPEHASAPYNLGTLSLEQGNLDKAASCLRRALEINPGFAEAHNNLGMALERQGELEPALDHYHSAIKLQFGFAEAFFNLGNVQNKLGNPEAAIESFRSSLRIEPNNARGLINLGDALMTIGKHEDALAAHRRAVEAEPDNAGALTNLGNSLTTIGKHEDALAAHRRAIEVEPNNAFAHNNLGDALLRMGRLKEGWAEFEEWRWRVEADGDEEKRHFPQTLWQGEGVKDKTVLVWSDQGVGDEVRFTGMVPDLLGAGARVILESDARLVHLFQRSFPGVECIAKSTPPLPRSLSEDIDFQTPGGRLCQWFRPDLESFPGQSSYLIADAERQNALSASYREGSGLLVGLAWNSTAESLGGKKYLPLLGFGPLARVPGVRFVDLQYGDTGDERAGFEAKTGVSILHDHDVDQMADLDAFAAQVAAMDLVISISNTTAHFSGALGVPTWVLLNNSPLSCWMLDRDDSPWYPSVKLFRQSRPGIWTDVVERVANELAKFING